MFSRSFPCCETALSVVLFSLNSEKLKHIFYLFTSTSELSLIPFKSVTGFKYLVKTNLSLSLYNTCLNFKTQ